MDKIEKAKQLFRQLEEKKPSGASEIAVRNFCIQERLIEIRTN